MLKIFVNCVLNKHLNQYLRYIIRCRTKHFEKLAKHY